MTDPERKSSTFGAAINLAKLCIGTGVLALPYATSRGGLLFGPLVIALVAAWNGIACRLMIECKNYCKDMTVPRTIGSTYGRIAYIATGDWGVRITDISIIITLLGVCIAYQITFASLIYDIPGNIFTKTTLTIISGIIVLPFSIAKDPGYLSFFSLFGLICLMIGVFSILFFGLWSYGNITLKDPFHSIINNANENLSFFPDSISDATIFIGVATFCFGMASLAFPIEESMEHKEQFQTAVLWSLIFVWSVYVAIGDLASILYLHDPQGISDNILTNLPEDSIAASLVRLSMALVCVLTFPLTFLAPAQIIEFALQRWISSRSSYQRIYDGEPDIPETSLFMRIGIRIGLIVLCTFFASAVPCFGMVISLLGCFTVVILSFILPPLFHLFIITVPKLNKQKSAISQQSLSYMEDDEKVIKRNYYIGVAHTLAGIVLSLIATSVTAFDVWSKLSSGAGCS